MQIDAHIHFWRPEHGFDNKPVADWKVTYKNSGIHKPSQLNAGTGTTPTIFNHGDFVMVNPTAEAQDGDVVAARLGEEAKVKTLTRRGDQVVTSGGQAASHRQLTLRDG